jgi:hypothetical protein
MNRILSLSVLLAATIGTYALVAISDDGVASEREERLATGDGADMAHYVAAAARDLGYKHVRAYDKGVFIDEESSHVSFFTADKSFVMNVGFDTRYRLPSKELSPALDALQADGKKIWSKAQALKEADHARASTVVVADGAARPAG